jgi:DNA-binding response OmpR family regulator
MKAEDILSFIRAKKERVNMKTFKKTNPSSAGSRDAIQEVFDIESGIHVDPLFSWVGGEDKRPAPAKILMISDQPESRSGLRKELQAAHYDVIAAENEAEGMSLAETIRPDLILLDMILSSKDGVRLCRQLKDHPATRPVPLIFIAPRGDTEAIVVGLDLGAVDYVLKPFRPMELQARIRRALALRGKPQRFYDEGLWLKNNFIGRASNALRNHVTVIAGFAALLDQKSGRMERAVQVSYLQEIIQHADHLADLTDGFESLFRAQGAVETVDLVQAVASAVEKFKPLTEKKEQRLIFNTPKQAVVTVRGHRRDLITAVRHLLFHVHKCTTEGGTIRVGIASRNQQARIELTTPGAALSPEQMDRIWVSGEMDLGLAIAQRVAERQGGGVGVESRPAEGSCFWMVLPMPNHGAEGIDIGGKGEHSI